MAPRLMQQPVSLLRLGLRLGSAGCDGPPLEGAK
jgi:hypothetical protein